MRRQFRSAVAALTRGVTFSEHSNILMDEAKARGYSRNIWLEPRNVEVVGVRAGERPITIVYPKVLELVNLSQVVLQEGASKMFNFKTEPLTHSSVTTTKPYRGTFAANLETKSTELGFTSKWWLPPSKLDSYKVQLGERQKPVRLYMNVKGELFNADQLMEPAAFDFRPISPMTGHFYANGPMSTDLSAFNRSVGARTGLMFTKGQLDLFKLALQPDAKGVSASNADPTSRFTLFSIEDLVDYEKILISLNRGSLPPEPRLLMTGASLLADAEGFKSRENKYAVSGRDISINGWELKKDAKPAVTSRYASFHTYSVMELANPTAGFEMAVRKPEGS